MNSKKEIMAGKACSTKVIAVSDILRLEMMLVFMGHSGVNRKFELYYMLVSCSDGGVLRRRKHAGELIRKRLDIKRGSYDMMIMELKEMGLIRVERGLLMIKGAEYIDWDNMPESILFKRAKI